MVASPLPGNEKNDTCRPWISADSIHLEEVTGDDTCHAFTPGMSGIAYRSNDRVPKREMLQI